MSTLMAVLLMTQATPAPARLDPLDEPRWGDCRLGSWPLIFRSPIFPQTQRQWDENEPVFAAYVLANVPEAARYSKRDAQCYSHSTTKEGHERFRSSDSTLNNGLRFVFVDWQPGMVGAQPLVEAVHDAIGKSAALAIDRAQGSRYGWAIDQVDGPAADARALDECQRTGSTCQIVLRFRGGCGAYVAQQSGGNVYGWGTATTRGDAEARATNEATRRKGTDLATRVWGCNAATGGKVAKLPPTPRVEPGALDALETEALRALNARNAAAAVAQNQKIAADRAAFEQRQREYEAGRQVYEQRQRDFVEASARQREAVEAANRAQRAYEAAIACSAGDRARCSPPPR